MSEPIEDPDHINNFGGPAFPVLDSNLDDGRHGMSLRDWFAGMALMSLGAMEANPRYGNEFEPFNGSQSHIEGFAKQAYRIADAMLEARRNGH